MVKKTTLTIKHPLLEHLLKFLNEHCQPNVKLMLGLSGGLDSIVLLHLLSEARHHFAFSLFARHIHHGLSPNADDWADFCRKTCADLSVDADVIKVHVELDSGLGLEASARIERYKALLNHDAAYLLLAHHQDDQAETMLLQLLRGAGAKGLAAMPIADAERRLLRPLLNITRHELQCYAEQHQLEWIEDESNANTDYDRNYIRHEVCPVIERRFPLYRRTMSRASGNLAEASLLLNELAAIDATQGLLEQQLDVAYLAQLSVPRAKNLLRWWLSEHQHLMPTAERLQEMLQQLLIAKPDANLKIAIDAGKNVWLRRYKGMAYIEKKVATPEPMRWRGESELELADGSRLLFEQIVGQGLAVERLSIKQLDIRFRAGGEHFKPDAKRPTRSLKHLLQEAGIPPWQRESLPLIYDDEKLLVVPGLGVAFDMQALPHEPGLLISWQQAI